MPYSGGRVPQLVRVDLQTKELSTAADGEPDGASARVGFVVALDADGSAPVVDGIAATSNVRFALPRIGLDDADLTATSITFYDGRTALAVIRVSGTLDPKVLELLVRRTAAAMADEASIARNGSSVTLDKPAQAVRGLAIVLLRSRMRQIEHGVLGALGDETIDADDYDALTKYAGRLSLVAELALQTKSPEPMADDRLRPRPRSSLYGIDTSILEPVQPDFFFKWADELHDEAGATSLRLSTLLSSQSVIVSRRQAQDAETFQRTVTAVGATVLVPGLIAAVFGANVALPGRDAASGLVAMLLLMVAAGLASFALLRLADLKVLTRSQSKLLRRWRALTPVRRAVLTLAAAAAIALAGAAVLVAA